ncbi:MAG: hypothetical protein JRN15_13055 [Nitrososphaerota archaeon]|nr:hypothetical protein [Nitrososphaerota archaeon]
MISFAITIVGILVATLVPAYLALYLLANLKFVSIRYIAALGLGLVFWFFFDTINDAAQLDVNSSFGGGIQHVAILVVFLAGISTLALFDHYAVPRLVSESSAGADRSVILLIPVAVAAVMGVHGLGEGWSFASVASASYTSSLTAAFGGVLALASYPLHKFFEASIVGALYASFIGSRNRARWHIPLLGILFGLPATFGAALGYFFSFDITYFYAFGVTAAIYAALRLVEPISTSFKTGQTRPTFLGYKVFIAVTIGFLFLYLAALFH